MNVYTLHASPYTHTLRNKGSKKVRPEETFFIRKGLSSVLYKTRGSIKKPFVRESSSRIVEILEELVPLHNRKILCRTSHRGLWMKLFSNGSRYNPFMLRSR